MRKNKDAERSDKHSWNLEMNWLCGELAAFEADVQKLRWDMLSRPAMGIISRVVRSRSAPEDDVSSDPAEPIHVLDTLSASHTALRPTQNTSASNSPAPPCERGHCPHNHSNAGGSLLKMSPAYWADQPPYCDWLLYTWKHATKRATAWAPDTPIQSMAESRSPPRVLATSCPSSPRATLYSQDPYERSGQPTKSPRQSPLQSPPRMPEGCRVKAGAHKSALSPRGRNPSPRETVASAGPSSPSPHGRCNLGNAMGKKARLSPSISDTCLRQSPQCSPSRTFHRRGVAHDCEDAFWSKVMKQYPSDTLMKETSDMYKFDAKSFTNCMAQGSLRVEPLSRDPSLDADRFMRSTMSKSSSTDFHKKPTTQKAFGQSNGIIDKRSGRKAVPSPYSPRTKPVRKESPGHSFP